MWHTCSEDFERSSATHAETTKRKERKKERKKERTKEGRKKKKQQTTTKKMNGEGDRGRRKIGPPLFIFRVQILHRRGGAMEMEMKGAGNRGCCTVAALPHLPPPPLTLTHSRPSLLSLSCALRVCTSVALAKTKKNSMADENEHGKASRTNKYPPTPLPLSPSPSLLFIFTISTGLYTGTVICGVGLRVDITAPDAFLLY